MSEKQNVNQFSEDAPLTSQEMDTIGEVMNISMGASATAISSMLDRQVLITTPKLELLPVCEVNFTDLEPAVVVKIKFIEGLNGTNVMVFRRRDMQIILDLLMGNEDIPEEDENFEFDELSISAACEVTNQMMGAAATALSELVGCPVNISTPDAQVSDKDMHILSTLDGFNEGPNEPAVQISFELSIKGVMSSSFMSVLPIGFARGIVERLMPVASAEEQPAAPEVPTSMPQAQMPMETPPAMAQPPASPPVQEPVSMPQPVPQQPAPQAPASMPAPQAPQQELAQMAPQQQMPAYPQQPAMYQQGMMPQGMGYPQQMMGYPQGMYPQQMPPDYYGKQSPAFAGPMGNMIPQQSATVKKAQFPDFSRPDGLTPQSASGVNMGMLLNVPLDVSVEIGKTKRKIKEIADFGQGTVLELEKQAGAPVDIIVNGQLLAHGDVVVIGDNFGVRITEIVGTKELMESLSGNGL